ncbi:lysophosphatidic acid receptor 6 [Triplophysa rosa]|uniref:Psychosine receptor-like n=1 Tax=Triplophysa rosa TaxID=992332 RepID=A0A9W7WN41_TRIRA|nr:lysophosphatidic acid receptor 6 [Triplophysa rosa]KAI7805238.1 putative psychosine receptor-like [Triplophysa rosa]
MILDLTDTTKILDNNNTALNNGTVNVSSISQIIRWISFAIGLPAIGFSIYLMSMQAKTGKAGPVYLISLLASDILNIFGRPKESTNDAEHAVTMNTDISSLIFYFGIISNIVFMVCIAQERYLLVTCPQYNAFCMKLKQSSMISLAVWAAPFAILFLAYQKYFLLFSIALLLPLPLLVFFCLDSFRALWCMKRPVAVTNRKKILAMQAVILSNYSIIYLPFVLNILLKTLSLSSYVYYLGLIADLLLYLGPLVDPFLSFFLTNGVRDILRAFPCCARRNVQQDTDAVDTETVETVSGSLTRL